MTIDQFQASIDSGVPPTGLDGPLQALWFDARSDWDSAHKAAQALSDSSGAWVHAYLHRKEGDLPNAGYWYRRAEREMPSCSLEEEWRTLVTAFIDT